MTISLTDTRDDNKDVHISDWMVENGFAEFGKMVRIRSNFLYEHNKKLLQSKSPVMSESTKSVNNDVYAQQNTCVNNVSKLAALKEYKSHYTSTSDCSSSLNKVFDVNDTIVDKTENIYGQKLFNRYKKLFIKKADSVKENKNDSNEKKESSFAKLMKAHSHCRHEDPEGKNLESENDKIVNAQSKMNELIINTDHKTKSYINKADKNRLFVLPSRSKSILNRLKNLKSV